jgi:hypothetical protein
MYREGSLLKTSYLLVVVVITLLSQCCVLGSEFRRNEIAVPVNSPVDMSDLVETARGRVQLLRNEFRGYEKGSAVASKSTSLRSPQLLAESRVSVESSTSYVNLYIYDSNSCGSVEYQSSWGTGVCSKLTSSSDSSQSTQYLWNSTNSALMQGFYSDTACANLLVLTLVQSFSGIYPNVCTHSIKYTLSDAFVEPSLSGYGANFYATSSMCNSASQPLSSFWESSSLTVDDDRNIFSCLSIVLEGQSAGNVVNYTASGYASTFLTGQSSGSHKSSSCFSGSELVKLESGEYKPISEVETGDFILSADVDGTNFRYAPVVAVPHDASNQVIAEFLQLRLLSGRDIMLTPDHLLLVSHRCDEVLVLSLASTIKPGMCLVSVSADSGSIKDEVITAVPALKRRGIHSVVTTAELIVVNDVVASPFANSHAIGHAYYNIHRFLLLIPGVPRTIIESTVIKAASLALGTLVEATFSM